MKNIEIDNIITLRKWAFSCETFEQLEKVEDDLYKRRAKIIKNYNLNSKDNEKLDTNVSKVLSAISTTNTLL